MNESELLVCELLNCDRVSLYQRRNFLLESRELSLISAALKRRIKGEPLQYILGKAYFFGLEFKVSTDVLIPRPETEILVEQAIKYSSELISEGKKIKILELGTGSGCIAVSLAKNLPEAEIYATDISEAALKIARENALNHRVDKKIRFIHSDLFSSYELRATSYELIISNPPYIPTAEISRLQPEISYEPRCALDGGRDGLDFYRLIARQARRYLKKDGLLCVEIGAGQDEAVKDILRKEKKFVPVKIVKDYNQIERVIVARKISKL